MSLRKEAEKITAKIIPSRHLGDKTPEVLQQELFSLMNTKPAFRDKDWQKNHEKLLHKIGEIKDPRIRQGLFNKTHAMFNGEA